MPKKNQMLSEYRRWASQLVLGLFFSAAFHLFQWQQLYKAVTNRKIGGKNLNNFALTAKMYCKFEKEWDQNKTDLNASFSL